MATIDVLPAIIFVLILFMGMLYVFYPALSISKSRSKVTVEVVTSSKESLSSQDDDILLSIVIPAYNEEERLPIMLDAALVSLSKLRDQVLKLAQDKVGSSSAQFEWIIVSDGSTDHTADVVKNYVPPEGSHNHNDCWKLVTLHTNSGKGAAVREGMLMARGALRLMVDADGATDFDALVKLLEHVNNNNTATTNNHNNINNNGIPIVFGSRAHLASQAQRSYLRTFLMHAFHLCVHVLVGSSTIQDTQCGFKLFTHSAAEVLFRTLHLQRWAFDIELVILANRLNLNIEEVGVPWHEVEGSKLDSSKLQLALVALGMLRDMLCVRLCYMLGIWNVDLEMVAKKEH